MTLDYVPECQFFVFLTKTGRVAVHKFEAARVSSEEEFNEADLQDVVSEQGEQKAAEGEDSDGDLKIKRKSRNPVDEENKIQVQEYKKVTSRADEVLGAEPQPTFISNCLPSVLIGGKTRLLAWNMVGIVCQRVQELPDGTEQILGIDIEFNDRSFHQNLNLTDFYGVSMCSLAYSGVFFASRGTQESLDEYEDDDADSLNGLENKKINKNRSNLHFRSFTAEPVTWHYELKKGETTECVASGTKWCAALTSAGLIRFFTQSGI